MLLERPQVFSYLLDYCDSAFPSINLLALQDSASNLLTAPKLYLNRTIIHISKVVVCMNDLLIINDEEDVWKSSKREIICYPVFGCMIELQQNLMLS